MSDDGQSTAIDPGLKATRLADLVAVIGRHEHTTRGHSDRVRSYSEMIGEEMGLDQEDVHKLRWAALLHDVGKLDVPVRILDKRGPLDERERADVEQHPVAAIGYLEPFRDWLGHWLLAATEHHEWWDGTGYPAGLAGEQISLAGRIVAVADAYDAMTSARSYKKSVTPMAARQELVDNAGTQFDPDVVRAFLNVGISRSRAGNGAAGRSHRDPGPSVVAGAGGVGVGGCRGGEHNGGRGERGRAPRIIDQRRARASQRRADRRRADLDLDHVNGARVIFHHHRTADDNVHLDLDLVDHDNVDHRAAGGDDHHDHRTASAHDHHDDANHDHYDGARLPDDRTLDHRPVSHHRSVAACCLSPTRECPPVRHRAGNSVSERRRASRGGR